MSATTSTEQALASLRAGIIEGHFEGGARLHIANIADRLNVSSGSVREALNRLTAEGLVTAMPQKGFRVTKLSLEDLLELTDARIHLETLTLGGAITDGDVTWERDIVATLHQLERTPYRDEAGAITPEWSEAHEEFHAALVAGCGNRWLLRLRKTLFDHSERYRRFSVTVSEERDINAEHAALAAAALERDAPLANQLMADHLARTADAVSHWLLRDAPTTPDAS